MQYQTNHRSPLSSLPTTSGPSKTFHLSNQIQKNEPAAQVVKLVDNKGNLSSPSAATAVQANIQKFGGGQSIVQRRTNQLQKKWDNDCKPAQPCAKTLKVEWYTCPESGRSKKRAVLTFKLR